MFNPTIKAAVAFIALAVSSTRIPQETAMYSHAAKKSEERITWQKRGRASSRDIEMASNRQQIERGHEDSALGKINKPEKTLLGNSYYKNRTRDTIATEFYSPPRPFPTKPRSPQPDNPVSVPLRPKNQPASGSNTGPYVVLANGWQDCCIWNPRNMVSIYRDVDYVYSSTISSLLTSINAEIRLVPWDSFNHRAGQVSSASNDRAFLYAAADFINNKLDPNRPLILIGHSYGGDSIISLLPRINRTIDFVAVLDPTTGGGLRAPLKYRAIPRNVRYFFNRWQRNALNMGNVVPFDSRMIDGYIPGCMANYCDQQEQNLERDGYGREIRIPCASWEITCPGYSYWPGGSNGTKAKRLEHNSVPNDHYITTSMAKAIRNVLNNRR